MSEPNMEIVKPLRGAIPRKSYPDDLKSRAAIKVFVGGCYERGIGSRFRAKAHTHYKTGWICFLSDRWLDHRPLVLHELAHAISGSGHTDKWRAVLTALGGTFEPTIALRSYEKR